MKRITILLITAVITGLLLVNFSCSKKSSDSNSANTGSDSVLLNIGNNMIVPAYQALAREADSLDDAITAFNINPSGSSLSNAQAIFMRVYIAWQSASAYDGFGPASTGQLTLSGINLFPATTSLINNNISAGNYNINTFANAAAKGLPALDYLLFGAGGNTLANYTTDAKAANRKLYLATVSADVKTEIDAVLNGWLATGGNYINTFVTGTGNSISSSLGLLINSMDQDFEILKNDRLGIPLGKQPPGSSLPVLPYEVEAYYSGISAQLALTQLKAIQALYLGTNTSGTPMGLDQYLIKVNAKYNGGLLSDTIKAHFTLAVSELQAIPDPLSQTIQTNPGPSDVAYSEIQKLVVLLKTDMPSSLGVLITYGDNDGD